MELDIGGGIEVARQGGGEVLNVALLACRKIVFVEPNVFDHGGGAKTR